MQDRNKAQSQLVNELAELRQKVAELTASEARCQQMEEALRESEARYQRITQAVTDYVYTVRVENGRAVETRHGAGCVAITGYTSEEYEADPYLWHRMVAEKDRPAVEDQARRVLAGEAASPLEHRITRRDGVERWVRNTPVLHRNGGGKLLAYDGLVQDITERKRAEEALRQYTTELEARNVELDAFAHTAAHDLKNPLSLIVGLAETLELDYVHLRAEEVGHYLHRLAQHALKMNNIIDELLLLAGVRQTEAKLYPLDMSSTVTGALQRLTDLTEAHQAEIVLPEVWPEALGYAPWVEEVWINYLSNAIKYGGRPPHVELGAETQADGVVRFSVRDNGPGIALEDQARLFTPFTRLDQVRAKGHGLGLSIVRRIVEKLGGQVGVQSQVGHGSTFYFTLPGSLVAKHPPA